MIVFALLLATLPAETADVVMESHALSLRPLALIDHGIALEYDHFLLPPWFSLAIGLGFSRSADGDYRADTYSTAIEARWWLEQLTPFHEPGKTRMIGPYAAFRVELELVDMIERKSDRRLGPSLVARERIMLGLRSTIEPAELTPSCGIGVVQDSGTGVLAAGSRVDFVCGLTLGVLF